MVTFRVRDVPVQTEQDDGSITQSVNRYPIGTKDRQGVGMEPTDDAHSVTHRPPDYSGASNMSIQPGKARD